MKIIEQLIMSTTEDRAHWKPDEDKWSLIEILNHITDIEVEDFRYNFNLILFKPAEAWPTFDEMEWITSRKYKVIF